MDNSFFDYLQRLELLAFFSGYPLLYALVFFISEKYPLKKIFQKGIGSLLPKAYALVGTLYLGLQLKKLYPYYTLDNIIRMQMPYLVIWGVLSILFWLPVFSKKPLFSLIHSLLFFFLLAKDLLLHSFQHSTDKSIVRNDMKIYTTSLLLNLGTYLIIVFAGFIYTRFKNQIHLKSHNRNS